MNDAERNCYFVIKPREVHAVLFAMIGVYS